MNKHQKHSRKKSKLLFLADSNGRYCGDIIRNSLENNFEVCSIFKHRAKMTQVIESIDQLTKDFTE